MITGFTSRGNTVLLGLSLLHNCEAKVIHLCAYSLTGSVGRLPRSWPSSSHVDDR